jgi:hypothetical protein
VTKRVSRMGRKPTAARVARRAAVGRKVFTAQKSLSAFNHDGRQYLSVTVEQVMRECERAYAMDNDYDRAEHLVKIIAYLIGREAPRFMDNPRRWIDAWKARREQDGLPAEGARVRA